jgi:flagellar basal-body rod protein FlgB
MTDSYLSRKLFDQTMSFIGRTLDLRAFSHKILSSNIANAETPGYGAKDASFEKLLERSMGPFFNVSLKKTHPGHLPEEVPSGLEVESSTEPVNLDLEMGKLAENNVMFHAGIQALIKKFEALKFTILDVGR